jgi:ankyrin repeat protein
VKLLLEQKADVNLPDKYGRTPLTWAARHKHDAVTKLLVRNAAVYCQY